MSTFFSSQLLQLEMLFEIPTFYQRPNVSKMLSTFNSSLFKTDLYTNCYTPYTLIVLEKT